jgi:probable F420-dependent oxidoreductase
MPAFGVLMFPTEWAIPPHRLAAAAEARGFESLFFPEHTHIPTSRRTAWPGGAELPKEYSHTFDPFVALTAAAMATTSLRLATGVCLVTEHDPIVLAKVVATLDHLSNGRVILGIGAGWNVEEMAHHGTAYDARWAVLRERVHAMRRIWRDDVAEFSGEYVRFEPIWSNPKPAQRGGPPVLLGASSRFVFDRIAEYGDGWMPIHQDARRAQAQGAVNYADGIQKTRAAWQKAERAGTPQFTIFGVGPDEKRVRELIAMGFDRIVFGLPPADADTVLPLLDRYAEIGFRINASRFVLG